MDRVLISIIVIVRNVEKYLPKCLDSLLAQRFTNYEIIIVESESTDSSGQIVDEYYIKFPDKIKVVHTPREGLGKARNRGLSLAHGDYIGFTDPDDWIEPDMFEKMYQKAVKGNHDLVICDYRAHFELDINRPCVTDRFQFMVSNAIRQVFAYHGLQDFGYKNIKANAILSGTTAVWNKIYHKDLIKDLRFDEKYVPEDYYFCLGAIIRSKNIAHVAKPLYHYRVRKESTIGQLRFFNDNTYDSFESIKIGSEMIKDQNEEIIDAFYERAVLNQFNWTIDYLNGLNDKEKRRDIAKKWSREMRETIPGWHTRKSVKKWVCGIDSNKKILEYYVNGDFNEEFDSILARLSSPPFKLSLNLFKTINKIHSH